MTVALVSVLGVVVPLLVQTATPDDSQLIFSLQHATNIEIFVIVSNQGSEPGTVALARLEVKGGKGIELRSSEPRRSRSSSRRNRCCCASTIPDRRQAGAAGERLRRGAGQICILSLDGTTFRGTRIRPTIERPCSDYRAVRQGGSGRHGQDSVAARLLVPGAEQEAVLAAAVRPWACTSCRCSPWRAIHRSSRRLAT
jgi:hypothetical protein